MEQLKIDFEPGVSKRHGSLLKCCSASVHAAGQDRVAAWLDKAPSNLCKALAESDKRKFGVDELETYMDQMIQQGQPDYEPIYYLIDKYLDDSDLRKKRALTKLVGLMPQLEQLINEAGE